MPLLVGKSISGIVVTIYAATCNEEKTEGRGRQVDNSYHKERRSALIACKGIDVMGTDGEVKERKAILLDDGRYFLTSQIAISMSEEEVKAAADLREKALAKLSQAERAALNL